MVPGTRSTHPHRRHPPQGGSDDPEWSQAGATGTAPADRSPLPAPPVPRPTPARGCGRLVRRRPHSGPGDAATRDGTQWTGQTKGGGSPEPPQATHEPCTHLNPHHPNPHKRGDGPRLPTHAAHTRAWCA